MPPPEQLRDVVIVGTGFSGISVAVALKKAGITDLELLDKGKDPGGTWRDNRYPGCACDVPSHLYSFSFAPNPRWSHVFSAQGEIRDYTESVIDRFDLRPDITLGARVVEARWLADLACWLVVAEDGRRWRARCLVTGTGALRVPRIPNIPGAEGFSPPAFHTARWRDDIDLEGKRVAVVGTGASAIQVVPALAGKVASLTLLQRTPPWILPRNDRAYTAAEQARFARWPWTRLLHRLRLYLGMESKALAFTSTIGVMKLVRTWGRHHIAAGIRDPALRAAVTPDYLPGCKRILLSDDYYPALDRDDVHLIAEPLARLDGDAVITAGGQRVEVDALIWATGFDLSDLLAPMRIVGREGRTLEETWAGLPRAYLGYAVHGFPNLMLMTGPNTGLGHNSMIYMIESMTASVVACVQRALASEQGTVEVKQEAEARFNTWLQGALARTVWASGCDSWYLDAEGRNPILWPGFTFGYRWRTRKVAWRDFLVSGG